MWRKPWFLSCHAEFILYDLFVPLKLIFNFSVIFKKCMTQHIFTGYFMVRNGDRIRSLFIWQKCSFRINRRWLSRNMTYFHCLIAHNMIFYDSAYSFFWTISFKPLLTMRIYHSIIIRLGSKFQSTVVTFPREVCFSYWVYRETF